MYPNYGAPCSCALHVALECEALQGGECCHLGHPAARRSVVISTKVRMLPPCIFPTHTLISGTWPNESHVTSTFQNAHLRPQRQGGVESKEATERPSCPPSTVVGLNFLLGKTEWKADPLQKFKFVFVFLFFLIRARVMLACACASLAQP